MKFKKYFTSNGSIGFLVGISSCLILCFGFFFLMVLMALSMPEGESASEKENEISLSMPEGKPATEQRNATEQATIPPTPIPTIPAFEQSPEKKNENGTEPAIIPPTPIPTIGENVMIGDFRLKILEASRLGSRLERDNQFIDPLVSNGEFIFVRVELENFDKDSSFFFEGKIVDELGREFSEYNSFETLFFINDEEHCFLEYLNPNVPKVCSYIYEVAQDASGLRLKIRDISFFGDEPVLVDLQLG